MRCSGSSAEVLDSVRFEVLGLELFSTLGWDLILVVVGLSALGCCYSCFCLRPDLYLTLVLIVQL